jgi:cysteine desulfurase / selenocysteine lyase
VQGIGILSARLDELGADVIASGGHKGLLGLTGSGIVYCREELVKELRADFVKQPAAEPVGLAHVVSQFDYVRTAHRFEGGNPNFLGIRVFRQGAEFLRSVGLDRIERRVRDLTTTFLRLLKTAGLDSQTPDAWEERAHIINVLVPDAAQLMDRLREKHHVVTNVKDGALRVSVSFYNDEEDLERAIRAIKQELGGKPASTRAA